MNIKEFKKGDIITRNEPVTYEHNNSKDSSYCGDKIELVSNHPEAKMIFIKHLEGFRKDGKPITLSYARDGWDEGWCYYSEVEKEEVV